LADSVIGQVHNFSVHVIVHVLDDDAFQCSMNATIVTAGFCAMTNTMHCPLQPDMWTHESKKTPDDKQLLLTLMTGIQTLLDLEAPPLQVHPTSLFLILTSLPSPGIYISPERVNTLEASSLNTPHSWGHSGKRGALAIAGTCHTLFFSLILTSPTA